MYMTEKEIMAKFGIDDWSTMTSRHFIEIGRSPEIDVWTKYNILQQSPYYYHPIDEETSLVAETIQKHFAQERIEYAFEERRNLINRIKKQAFY